MAITISGKGTRRLKPLSASLSFSFQGGYPTQSINSVSGEHAPNWILTPVKIIPIITITDPEGLVTGTVHNKDVATSNMSWVIEKGSPEGNDVNILTTATGGNIVVDTSNTDSRGALTIKKNYNSGFKLRFDFKFIHTDTGTGIARTVTHSSTVDVKVNKVSDARVQVVTRYPRGQGVIFPSKVIPADPIMEMELFIDGGTCPAAYQWYSLNAAGNETKLNGKTDKSLTIQAGSIKTLKKYRCKALDIRKETLEAAGGPVQIPAVWPSERTYTRDFTLAVQTVPYELVLKVDGQGEETIVTSGSPTYDGEALKLFNWISESSTEFKSSIFCKVGKDMLTPEETAKMFDITWPAGSTIDPASSTKAVVKTTNFDLTIQSKYTP